jgi:hypothetical protein
MLFVISDILGMARNSQSADKTGTIRKILENGEEYFATEATAANDFAALSSLPIS